MSVDYVLRDAIGSLDYAIYALEAPEGASMRDTARELVQARFVVADMIAALEDASAYISGSGYVDRAKWLAVRETVDAAIIRAKGKA